MRVAGDGGEDGDGDKIKYNKEGSKIWGIGYPK